MKTTREKVIEQIKLKEELQTTSKINIVNCGSCGAVLLHKVVDLEKDTPTEDYDITCPYCDFTSEPCDFPDFLYSGMENSAEFDEEPKYICNSCHEHFSKEEMEFDAQDSEGNDLDCDLCKNCNHHSFNDAPYGNN